jgi:hypothetical protein
VLKGFGAVLVFVLVATSASAQSPSGFPPSPSLLLRGFVPPYEILRTVRAAGFDPLAPPLRQGTTYVVRAIDLRGVPVRVVVDAHSGAIRDANRIVSGYGLYGPYAPGPYAPGPYPPGPYPPGHYAPAFYARLPPSLYSPPVPDEMAVYGRLPHVGTLELPPSDQDELRGPPTSPRFVGTSLVPLPRPRPTALAVTSAVKRGASPDSKKPDSSKSDSNPDTVASEPTTPVPSEPARKSANGSMLPAIND